MLPVWLGRSRSGRRCSPRGVGLRYSKGVCLRALPWSAGVRAVHALEGVQSPSLSSFDPSTGLPSTPLRAGRASSGHAQDRPSHQGTRTESTQASEYLSRDDLPAWAKRCHAERWVSVFPSTSAVHRSRQGCRIEGRTSRLCREFRALLDDTWLEGALFAYIDMTQFHLVTACNLFSSPFYGLA
jgi:hypothetical protein